MKGHTAAKRDWWQGRSSGQQWCLHEKVQLPPLPYRNAPGTPKAIALVGYACDEGVRRNLGRPGAAHGPDAIRSQLAKMPNHLDRETALLDLGNLSAPNGDMEAAQQNLAQVVQNILGHTHFPIVLGGGHDLAYGHLMGLKLALGKEKKLGIINFDAHFDLRNNGHGNHSGTPFFQFAKDCERDASGFHYLCLGIRQDANHQELFKTAETLGAQFVPQEHFNMHFLEHVQLRLVQFMEDVDLLYTTIDLDGFSSAFAPGCSAASPMGFSPDIVLECLKLILASGKAVSLDIAEMNPEYDRDHQTAKLAASLVHFVLHQLP
ncbi:formimidoylglutamase [Maribacter sp. 2307ULW6-5]|uniref:formimidoylglutamase n=1 Tax=Maribacter sp. 2307ULW6-5 TaxID=3386275 RepID=UPI0039BCB144